MARHDDRLRFFATASRGTEDVLARELHASGIRAVEPQRGGAAFGATLEDAYRACLWSRIASRVLMPLTTFAAEDADALYQGVHAVHWPEHLGADRTLAVQVAGSDAPAGPAHFIALKTKDAIVDRVRTAEGARPDVDKRRPDVRVHVHVRGPRVTVSLDLANRALHHRGLGRRGSPAPLRETLAAALLWIAGWPERTRSGAPLCDPMCGSGTLLLEAAAIALDVAPGLARDRAGFEGWRGHDAALWNRLRAEARERRSAARSRRVRIAGADASAAALEAAATLIGRAGFGDCVRLRRADLADAEPPWHEPGLLVTNPPYGERLGETGALGPLYEMLGDVLKRRFPAWSAWVLSGNRALDKRIGLRPASRRVLFNGPIECRFLEIPLAPERVAGTNGPGWRKPSDEARGFARKLADNAKRLDAWASQERIEAYRLYDADVPIYNLAIDRYGEMLRLEEGPRPRRVATADADRRLQDALRVVSDVLGVESRNVVLPAAGPRGRRFVIREGDLRLWVEPAREPDGGLPLDERGLRHWVRARASGLDVLDLTARTCVTALAAAAGGARSTTSVDRTRRLLDWGGANFELNSMPQRRHHRLSSPPRGGRFGLIVIVHREPAPGPPQLPTRLLAPGGTVVIAGDGKELRIEELTPPGFAIREITDEITPPDFARRRRLRAWVLRLDPSRRS